MISVVTNYEDIAIFTSEYLANNGYSGKKAKDIVSRLLRCIVNTTDILVSIKDRKKIIGVICLYPIATEKYLELGTILTKSKKALNEFMTYLETEYHGYSIDLCLRTKEDSLVLETLNKYNAIFETEQKTMIYSKAISVGDTARVVPYSSEYEAEYRKLHITDVYWVAEKVIEAKDMFVVFLAIKDSKVVGYIDLRLFKEINTIYSIYIDEAYRNMGYGRELLLTAIKHSNGTPIDLTVDIDNYPAMHLYEKIGFVNVVDSNNITAHLKL